MEKQRAETGVPSQLDIDELRRRLRERAIPSEDGESRTERLKTALCPLPTKLRAAGATVVGYVRTRDWRSAAALLGSSARSVLITLGRVAVAVSRASWLFVRRAARLTWVAARAAARSAHAASRWLASLRSPEPPPRPTAEQDTIEKVLDDPTAEQLRRAEHRLMAKEQRLGYERPEVAAELHLIGALHHEAGRYDEAAAFYTKALAIRERTLGPDHPEVAAALEDLAAARREAGDVREAEVLLLRARTIHELRERAAPVAV